MLMYANVGCIGTVNDPIEEGKGALPFSERSRSARRSFIETPLSGSLRLVVGVGTAFLVEDGEVLEEDR